jgi:MFS family permease
VLLAFILPTFIVSPLAGFLYDRIGFKVVFIGYLFSAILFPILGIPQKLETMIVCLSISSGAFSLAGPLMAELSKCVPKHLYAKSYGLLNVAVSVGMFLGPTLGVKIYEHYQFFGVCVSLGAICLAYTPFAYLYKLPEVET